MFCAAACGADKGTGSATADAPLVMARVKDAIGLDPSHQNTSNSLDTSAEVMETLVAFKPGSFTIVPALATRWHADATGTFWSFTLRRGAVFSDGTPVDAAAVKFNFDRWRLANNPYHGTFAYPFYSSLMGASPSVIRDVRVISPTEVGITLRHPFGPFLRDLAIVAFAIGSPTAIKADMNAFERRPVGSGPYEVSEWVRDDHITLTANPRYSGPLARPTFHTVIIRDIPDQATSVLSIEKGDIAILAEPRADDAKALAQHSGVAIVEQPPNNVGYLALNLDHPPFDRLLVRRAVAAAIDTTAIAAALYAPGTVVASNFIPPGYLGENRRLRPYRRDLKLARALLAQAGLRAGFSTELAYPTTPRPYMPEPQRLAETLQAQLKDAGINVTLAPYEFGVFLSKAARDELPMCVIGWTGANGDPDGFLYPLLDQDSAHKGTAENYSFWRDPVFHALMLAGQETVDERKRARIYEQANARVHDQVPVIPIIHTVVPIALSTTIRGFVPSPDTRYHLERITPALPGR